MSWDNLEATNTGTRKPNWAGTRAQLPAAQGHLVGLVADPTAEGLPSDVGHHVALQHGGGTEDLPTGGAGVVLLGVHLVDVLPVVLQGGEAHPALLAIIGIFYVWVHERKAHGERAHAAVSNVALFRCHTVTDSKHLKSLEQAQGVAWFLWAPGLTPLQHPAVHPFPHFNLLDCFPGNIVAAAHLSGVLSFLIPGGDAHTLPERHYFFCHQQHKEHFLTEL